MTLQPLTSSASMAIRAELSDTQYVIRSVEQRRYECLYLHYQPQYHSKSGALVGFETLARMRHPQGHIISPKHFIPALHNKNLLPDFDIAVMLDVISTLPILQKIFGESISLSINVSQSSICRPDFKQQLMNKLRKQEVPPENIFLEMTETERPIVSIENLARSIHQLSKLGVHLSLDDFGTGYSTIEQLAVLPLSEIKIDRQFVQNLDSKKGQAIVNAITDLGRSVATRIVAEGIETQAQHDFFASHDHPFIVQGFFYSKPQSFGQLILNQQLNSIRNGCSSVRNSDVF